MPAPRGRPSSRSRAAIGVLDVQLEFDVDPGVDVDVYLTRGDDDVADRIELGDLKGNVGDQQYAIPGGADR